VMFCKPQGPFPSSLVEPMKPFIFQPQSISPPSHPHSPNHPRCWLRPRSPGGRRQACLSAPELATWRGWDILAAQQKRLHALADTPKEHKHFHGSLCVLAQRG
jgi:hypothetical protein